MVRGSNLDIDDALNLLDVGCCGVVNTLRFGSHGESSKGLVMEGYSVCGRDGNESND